jgi:arylsulfatase A-like enzyme
MNKNYKLLSTTGTSFYITLILLATIGLLTACKKNVQSVQNKKPNIIFLFTDDQRWDALGAMGNSIIKTPNLDKMANAGVLFKNAYVTTSICCVSRASVLSGQYESRHGINDFVTSFKEEALKKTYPSLLKNEGYKIGFIGKYGVGNPIDQPKEMFYFWAGTNKHQPDYEQIDDKGNLIHYTDIVGNNIDSFLNSSNKNNPFCLSVSFKAPHVQDNDERQFIPNVKYKDYYKEAIIPEPETADPKYWNAFPDFFRTEENIARERWKLRFDTKEKYQESVKNYYRLITGVDDVVGKMRDKLKEKGLDKNTVIIFMGDNGMFLGEHGLAGKWYGYEESIRVPLIIYDPRNESSSSKISEEIALNIDIAPTILELAGIATPDYMQGINLTDHTKINNSIRQSFFYEHTFLGSPKIPKVEGVVSPTVKYMKYIEHDYEELFDLINDPHEKNNLIANPNYSKVLDEQRSVYEKLKQQVK